MHKLHSAAPCRPNYCHAISYISTRAHKLRVIFTPASRSCHYCLRIITLNSSRPHPLCFLFFSPSNFPVLSTVLSASPRTIAGTPHPVVSKRRHRLSPDTKIGKRYSDFCFEARTGAVLLWRSLPAWWEFAWAVLGEEETRDKLSAPVGGTPSSMFFRPP